MYVCVVCTGIEHFQMLSILNIIFNIYSCIKNNNCHSSVFNIISIKSNLENVTFITLNNEEMLIVPKREQITFIYEKNSLRSKDNEENKKCKI